MADQNGIDSSFLKKRRVNGGLSSSAGIRILRPFSPSQGTSGHPEVDRLQVGQC